MSLKDMLNEQRNHSSAPRPWPRIEDWPGTPPGTLQIDTELIGNVGVAIADMFDLITQSHEITDGEELRRWMRKNDVQGRLQIARETAKELADLLDPE